MSATSSTSLNERLTLLRGSLLMAASLLILGGVTAVLSHKWQSVEENRVRQAQSLQSTATAKLNEAQHETQEIAQRLQLYSTLNKRGILGEEHRLDWIEQLRQLQQEIGLTSMEFEFLPQKPADSSLNLPSMPGYRFVSSTLNLRLTVLHEGDVQRLLERLPQQASALILTKACSIEPPTNRSGQLSSPLTVQCTQEWITLRPTLDSVSGAKP